jgi:carboxyl-terminal processing protease
MLFALALTLVAPSLEFETAWKSIEAEIREHYFARESRKGEVDRYLREFGPKAIKAKTRDEFAGIVRSMLAEFNDSHFYFFTKDDELFYGIDGASRAGWDGIPQDGAPYPGLGVWFWPTEQGYQVWNNELLGPAYKAGVRRLDIFKTCEGEPFHPVRSLRGKVGKTLRFGIIRAGKHMELRLPVKAMHFWQDLTAARTAVGMQYKGKNFLYLWISHMYGPEGQFNFYARGGSDSEGIILDLRDGLGGYFEPHLLPFFLPDADVKWRVPGIQDGGWKVGLKKPMVVLTNSRTISAREFAAYYLRKHAGATIVGEPTAGGVLGGYVTKTYGWWNMMIPAQEYSIDGIVFERNPLVPDVRVEDHVSEDGGDAILERGVDVLFEKVSGR